MCVFCLYTSFTHFFNNSPISHTHLFPFCLLSLSPALSSLLLRALSLALSMYAQPCAGHTASVEDIAWSPSERTVFASGSVDETVRIWDLRAGNRCALTVKAHSSDVNTISWNRCEQVGDGSVTCYTMRYHRVMPWEKGIVSTNNRRL